MKRLDGLDTLRGIAIVLMVIFHFSYDLNHFHYININITHGSFWLIFRSIIVSIFLFVSGVSLALVHKYSINWTKVKARAVKLAIASLLVTIGTYIIFPNAWVYFGILHAIFIFSLLGLIFINRAILSLFVAALILITYYIFNINMHPIFDLVAKPLHLPIYHTVDLVPFTPWFSIFLIGIAVVSLGLEKNVFNIKILSSNNTLNIVLRYLGKHSLLIYLIHQPILFGIFYLLISL